MVRVRPCERRREGAHLGDRHDLARAAVEGRHVVVDLAAIRRAAQW